MPEHHEITGRVTGVPLPAGAVGASVRIALDSPPSPRWSQAFSARLTRALLGGPSVAHLRLDRAVQGADIVLDGIENRQAERLGDALRLAVEAANATPDDPRAGAEHAAVRRGRDRPGRRRARSLSRGSGRAPTAARRRRSPRGRG